MLTKVPFPGDQPVATERMLIPEHIHRAYVEAERRHLDSPCPDCGAQWYRLGSLDTRDHDAECMFIIWSFMDHQDVIPVQHGDRPELFRRVSKTGWQHVGVGDFTNSER